MDRDSSEAPDRPAAVCGPGCACAVGNEFGERQARRDLDALRRRGPDRTTRWLIEGLTAGGVAGLTVLDIGAAIDAALGLGLHPTIETAVAEMTRVADTVEPDPARHHLYDELYRRVYRKMYDRLQPLYAEIMAITGYPPS